jgi:Na+-transporting methylmalonyl-CoA/oxaloacetate decarboxylase gamma subunit
MSELLRQGLQISVLGMGLTFAALGLLILTIKALHRLFGDQTVVMQEDGMMTAVNGNLEDEVAAAITVALSKMQAAESPPSGLGEALEKGRSPWWYADSTVSRRGTKAHARDWRQDD